jgi:hypothetical protein
MLTLPLRQAPGGRANGAEKRAGPRLVKTAALATGDVFWLALIAALFICWAMSPSTRQSLGLTGESPGCRFAGRPASFALPAARKRFQVKATPVSSWARLGGTARCRPNRMTERESPAGVLPLPAARERPLPTNCDVPAHRPQCLLHVDFVEEPPVVASALGILGRSQRGELLPLGLMWRISASDEG